MPDTKIAFHSDMFERPKAAINVKIYSFGKAERMRDFFWRLGFIDQDWEEIVEAVFDNTQIDFWDWAGMLAKEYGYKGVFSEGRSDGWLVTDPHLYEEDLENADTLDKFLDFREDIQAYIKDVPNKMYEALKEVFETEEKAQLLKRSVTARSIVSQRSL